MTEPRPLPSFAWRPVAIVTALVCALLGATANEYGYHRDELYFRMLGFHPAWSYFDEPPMTPLLARGSIAIFGDSLWALRLPAILCAAASIVIVALICREFGGGSGAQTIATVGVTGSFLLVAGHVLLTASPDMVVWSLVLLFVLRAVLREQDRWWIYNGITVGIGLYNKQLVLLLLIGLGAGLLISGPRQLLRNRALWLGMAIAAVIALPTLIYQVINHFPELTMSHVIEADKGANDRVTYLPFQLILVTALWIYGFVGMFTVPAWRRLRFIGWAYAIVSVIVLVTGGQIYYTFGLLAFFMAAAAARLPAWVGTSLARRAWVAAALVVSVAFGVLLGLPTVPAASLHSTPIGAINQAARDQVGWPTYVQEVAAAYSTLSPADRAHTTIVVGNYGEAGAIDRFGGRYALPRVYSGQNQLYFYGPPPSTDTVVVFVSFAPSDLSGQFASCRQVGVLDNRIDVDNEEQGIPITICHDPTAPWSTLWPTFKHAS